MGFLNVLCLSSCLSFGFYCLCALSGLCYVFRLCGGFSLRAFAPLSLLALHPRTGDIPKYDLLGEVRHEKYGGVRLVGSQASRIQGDQK